LYKFVINTADDKDCVVVNYRIVVFAIERALDLAVVVADLFVAIEGSYAVHQLSAFLE
jgi:hypothetical protein